MSRSQRRMSRGIVGVLAAVLAVGLFFWMKNAGPKPAPADASTATTPSQNSPAPAPKASDKPATPAIVTQTPAVPKPIVTQTPTPVSRVELSDTPKDTSPADSGNTPDKPVAAAESKNPLADGRARMAAGQLVEARSILNSALVGGKLSEVDSIEAKKLLSEINQTLIFSPERLPGDPYVGGYNVKSGDRLAKIAQKYDVTWELLCRINRISDPGKLRAGKTIKVIQGPFHAVVSKSKFTIDLYLGSPGERGSLYVTTFKVGLGKSDSTPTGTWMVAAGGKLKNPKFWGAGDLPPMEADDPQNPLGERWIALEGTDGQAVGADGYGIHGTIDPESIGKMASLGCIRLKNEDVELVYDLLVDGKSTVIVKP
jgi:lipoprotein-anchoring transpeptidase ErfK/SrfK